MNKSHLQLVERFTIKRAIEYLRLRSRTDSVPVLAQIWKIHNSHIYRAIKTGYVSPKLKAALIESGAFCKRPSRRRAVVDVPDWMTDEETAEFRKNVRQYARYEANIIKKVRNEKQQ